MLESIVAVDPRWHGKRARLLVRSCLQDSDDSIEHIESVVRYLLRWKNWSDTRWAGVGPAARLLLGSMCCGLEGIVAEVQANGANNERFYLTAARSRLEPAVKRYVAVAAFAAYPMEAFSLQLLEDDRWLLRARGMWEEIQCETDFLAKLPPAVWAT
eukprot:3664966-Lingulodinium_polyedra.AAC.1